MQNAGLDGSQAGIKIAGRNINNLSYANDTTVRNVAGRRSHPYGPLIRAFYRAVALGQNSRGWVSKEARRGGGSAKQRESAG